MATDLVQASLIDRTDRVLGMETDQRSRAEVTETVRTDQTNRVPGTETDRTDPENQIVRVTGINRATNLDRVSLRTGNRYMEDMDILITTITTTTMADTTTTVAGIGRSVQWPLEQRQVWHLAPLSTNWMMTVAR